MPPYALVPTPGTLEESVDSTAVCFAPSLLPTSIDEAFRALCVSDLSQRRRRCLGGNERTSHYRSWYRILPHICFY